MHVKRYTTLWPVLIPISIGALLIGSLVIVHGTRSSTLAYACGFVGGQAATIHQIEPSKTMKPDIPICVKFRDAAIAAGFVPAGREVNYGH